MRSKRHGIATTELALCLPVIFAVTFGVIETTTAIHLKETATLAAYEAARVGVRKSGTNEQARTKATEFLDSRSIQYDNNTIQISDPGFDTAGELEHVSVTVSIPCRGNTITSVLFGDTRMTAVVTMRKEYPRQ